MLHANLDLVGLGKGSEALSAPGRTMSEEDVSGSIPAFVNPETVSNAATTRMIGSLFGSQFMDASRSLVRSPINGNILRDIVQSVLSFCSLYTEHHGDIRVPPRDLPFIRVFSVQI